MNNHLHENVGTIADTLKVLCGVCFMSIVGFKVYYWTRGDRELLTLSSIH